MKTVAQSNHPIDRMMVRIGTFMREIEDEYPPILVASMIMGIGLGMIIKHAGYTATKTMLQGLLEKTEDEERETQS